MMIRTGILLQLIALLAGQAAAVPTTPQCKATPDSSDWPSAHDWNSLNDTLKGQLLAPLPPAIVCDRTRPQYDQKKCDALAPVWFTALFHDADPISVQNTNWQWDGCLPDVAYNTSHVCNLKPFPKYTVNATTAQHVAAGTKFANEKNLRVSIKNTGHDYLGRSTSFEYSIWTHNLKKVEVHDKFSCCGYSGGAVTVGGGTQIAELYGAASDHDFVVVAGAEPSVGMGGYLTGGGHSPIGAVHGLAVDNIVEMEIVTPTGEIVTANECQNSDLFWAMRGGGGSTFGVLISATLKTFPNFHTTNFTLVFYSDQDEATKNNNDHFYNLVSDMYQALIGWSDNLVNGYFTYGPAAELIAAVTGGTGSGEGAGAGSSGTASPSTAGGTQPMLMAFTGWAHKKTQEETNALFEPFVKSLNTTSGITGFFTSFYLDKATDALGGDTASTAGAGFNTVLGSRLWSQENIQNKTAIPDIIRTIATAGGIGQGLVVSGPAVRDNSMTAKTSVTPAWRKSYIHNLGALVWGYRNETERLRLRNFNTNVMTKALRDHAPDMGAYLNEADKYEPNSGQAFWGSNYERLLKVKKKYDPNGVFWCIPCVGNEDWTLDHKTQRLCKAAKS